MIHIKKKPLRKNWILACLSGPGDRGSCPEKFRSKRHPHTNTEWALDPIQKCSPPVCDPQATRLWETQGAAVRRLGLHSAPGGSEWTASPRPLPAPHLETARPTVVGGAGEVGTTHKAAKSRQCQPDLETEKFLIA